MAKKVNVKDKLLDDTLDLSCCDLMEVPVKEISVLRRASIVDLSNNNFTLLPNNFITLTQIIKLDLSKNNLTELPENFGQLVQLRHLDLYSNQISRLPLSLANLKNLRWLDLKENPLTPSVASVAGPCSNTTDCQNCARNIVNYLTKIKQTFDEAERSKKLNEQSELGTVPKKETQKKKKKKVDKDKNMNSSGDSHKQTVEKINTKSNKSKQKNKIQKPKKGGLIRFLCSAISWFLLLIFFTVIIIPFLPNAEEILDYVKEKTGLPIQRYKIDIPISPVVKEKVQLFVNYSRSFANDISQKYFNYSLVEINKEI